LIRSVLQSPATLGTVSPEARAWVRENALAIWRWAEEINRSVPPVDSTTERGEAGLQPTAGFGPTLVVGSEED
jgi:hypothetical protein